MVRLANICVRALTWQLKGHSLCTPQAPVLLSMVGLSSTVPISFTEYGELKVAPNSFHRCCATYYISSEFWLIIIVVDHQFLWFANKCDFVTIIQINAFFTRFDIIWNYLLNFEATIIKFFMGKQATIVRKPNFCTSLCPAMANLKKKLFEICMWEGYG